MVSGGFLSPCRSLHFSSNPFLLLWRFFWIALLIFTLWIVRTGFQSLGFIIDIWFFCFPLIFWGHSLDFSLHSFLLLWRFSWIALLIFALWIVWTGFQSLGFIFVLWLFFFPLIFWSASWTSAGWLELSLEHKNYNTWVLTFFCTCDDFPDLTSSSLSESSELSFEHKNYSYVILQPYPCLFLRLTKTRDVAGRIAREAAAIFLR